LTSNKRVQIFGPLMALFLGLFCAISMYSQVTGATLSGTVTDASGGAIPGAEISVINTATGVNKSVTVDSAGYYSIPNLPAGVYEVSVSATGFSKSVQSNLNLAVGAQQQLNFALKIGVTTETLVVNEAAPQIDLSSSTLTGQVESKTVLELPLNGRDWTSLATLQPGVNGIESQMSYDTAARGNRGFGAELTVSGQRPTQNNYRLDGVSINDYANSGPGNVIGIALGVDAIQEFSVLTGSFSAEYGRASGGSLTPSRSPERTPSTVTPMSSYATALWTRKIISPVSMTHPRQPSDAISSESRRVVPSSRTKLLSSVTMRACARRRESRLLCRFRLTTLDWASSLTPTIQDKTFRHL
jgi:hypothetical protein